MAVSFYDVSVGTFAQILPAVAGVLEKGRTFCESEGIALDEIVEARLRDDMRPFRFQVASVAHHSRGALQGIEAGEFSPPAAGDADYAGLQALVAEALADVNGYSREAVEALEGKDVTFKIGDNGIPFVAADFLLTFSLPNFYFHAATAYDILRMKGAPLGKRDFMGKMRMKR